MKMMTEVSALSISARRGYHFDNTESAIMKAYMMRKDLVVAVAGILLAVALPCWAGEDNPVTEKLD